MGPFPFSEDARALRPSPIRRFATILNDPSIISFAGGVPNPLTFPAAELAKAAESAARRNAAVALQYGPTAGLPALRERIAALLSRKGIAASADSILVTTGSQQALDLLARVLLDPGDAVAVESPAYVGALAAFRARRAVFVAARRSAGEIALGELSGKLEAARKAGKPVRLLYTIPNFQNPSGWTLSAEGRGRLLEVANRFDVVVVEDDPYGEVYFSQPPPASLASADREGRVVYLGSFSKTLAAGLRCGFLHGPREILARVELLKQAADLCSSSFDQSVLAAYFDENDYDAHLTSVRGFYAGQKARLSAALRQFLPPSVSVSDPAGGLFAWAKMPDGMDAETILETSLEKERVAFIPGAPFFVEEGPAERSHFRLTFAKEPPERLEEGARRLGELLHREIR